MKNCIFHLSREMIGLKKSPYSCTAISDKHVMRMRINSNLNVFKETYSVLFALGEANKIIFFYVFFYFS